MPRIVSNRKFGVEIEFVGISQLEMLQTLQDAEIPVQEYGSYRNGRWIVKDDGSVHGPGGAGELVSPPLSGLVGLEEVKTVCQKIRQAGATANASCGLHVHIDASGLTGAQMANVVRLYTDYQSVINQILPQSRANNRYARALTRAISARLDLLSNTSSTQEIRRIVNHIDRYQAVNLAAFARHGTIEFRQHNGTTNALKITNWIRFCLALVEKARTMTPEASLTAPSTPARTRGRPPNYEDRRALWSLLGSGLYDAESLSDLIGHSLQTTRRWIRELGACHVLIEDNGTYRASRRISAANRVLLNNWLGVANVTPNLPVRLPRRPPTHRSLFEGMSTDLYRYYVRRAATFGHSWTN